MIRTTTGRVLAVALCALMPGAAAAEELPQGYALGVGDSVHAAILGRADLSGEFVVGHDRSLRMPLLGSVPAAGQTLDELEQAIAARLRQMFDVAPQLALRIAAYRPVFVIGAVATPGEQVFLPGMTALKAFAKAGGAPSLRNLTASRLAESAVTDNEIRQARSDVNRLLVRQARIQAALDGKASLELPPELAQVAKASPFDAVVEREQSLLRLANESSRAQQQMLARQLASVQDEIEALNGQYAALGVQGDAVNKELDRILGLAQKGLATSGRMLELQQLKANVDSDRFRVVSYLSRARQVQADLELRARRFTDDQRQQRLTELAEVSAELDRSRGRLDTASARLSILSEVELQNVDSDRMIPAFVITREEDGSVRRLTADSGTALRPGDVLEVQLKQQGVPVAVR